MLQQSLVQCNNQFRNKTKSVAGGWQDLQGEKVLSLTEMKCKNTFLIYYKCNKHYSFTLNHRTNFLCYIWILLYHPPPYFLCGFFFTESVLEQNTNIFQFLCLTALTWCFMSWLDSVVLTMGTVKQRRKCSCFQILTRTFTGGLTLLLLLQLIHWLAQTSRVTEKFICYLNSRGKKKLNEASVIIIVDNTDPKQSEPRCDGVTA